MRPLTARLAGRRHHQGPIEPLSRFELVLEPTNEADREAVALFADERRVGYLEPALASVVRRLLIRGRPILVAPTRQPDTVLIYLPEHGDAYGETLLPIASSDGRRRYWIDLRRGHCTCPAGRWVICRHRRAVGVLPKSAA
jgi:hypothetical protein